MGIDSVVPVVSLGTMTALAFADVRTGGGLWPILLEKAWAKIHLNYDAVLWSESAYVLKSMTGAPTV